MLTITKWVLSVFIIPILSISAFCQDSLINLVPNGDFSTRSNCPNDRGQIAFAPPWWSPNGRTSDLAHKCAGNQSFAGIPGNSWGWQVPVKGDGYAGIRTWLSPSAFNNGSNYREYLAVELTEAMIGGEQYFVSFSISAGDSARYVTDDIGLHFARDSIPTDLLLDLPAHISNTEGFLVRSITGWKEISGIYTSKGQEKFLVIGNFKDDDNTTIEARFSNDPLFQSTYFFVDDVRVEPCSSRFPEKLISTQDTSVCPGESAELEGVELEDATYVWDTGETDRTIRANDARAYVLTMDIRGCQKSDTLLIKEGALPDFELAPDTTLCPGSSLIIGTNEVADRYEWSTGDTTQIITVSDEGTYTLSLANGSCVVSDAIRISYDQAFPDVPERDTTICQENEPELVPSLQGLRYEWQDQSQDPTLSIQTSGTYFVDVFNSCFSQRETFFVKIEDCGCETFVPNVFSPNEDGNNDQFVPQLSPGVENFQLFIFDRWGTEVFQSNDQGRTWDGAYKGKILSDGVYYWVMQYECLEDGQTMEKYKKGNLTLLR